MATGSDNDTKSVASSQEVLLTKNYTEDETLTLLDEM